MIIKLSEPITYDDEPVTEISLDANRMRARDLKAIEAALRKAKIHDILQPESDPRYLIAVAARASGMDPEFFDLLSGPDYTRVKVEVQGFLLGSVAEDGATTASES